MTLTVHVEEIAFGRVFNVLDGMPGVINIALHARGPKPNGHAKANGSSMKGQKMGGANSVLCIVLGAMIEAEEPVERAVINAAVTAAGKSATSVPDALNKLTKLKTFTKLSNGTYKVTATGRKYYANACAVEAPAKGE
jgi:hypothetical protein